MNVSDLRRALEHFDDTDQVAVKINGTWYEVHPDEIDFWAGKDANGMPIPNDGHFVIDLDSSRSPRA